MRTDVSSEQRKKEDLADCRAILEADILKFLASKPDLYAPRAADIREAVRIPKLLIRASRTQPPRDRPGRVLDAALQRLRRAGCIQAIGQTWHITDNGESVLIAQAGRRGQRK